MNINSMKTKVLGLLKKPQFLCMGFTVLLSLAVRLKYAYVLISTGKGFPKSQDSFWYIDHARELLQNFKIDPDINGIFYIGYYGLLALILLLFKSDAVMVLLQVIINALSVILVYRISEIIFGRLTAFIAGIIYAFTFELKFWSVYILTDSLFVTSLLLAVYFWLIYRESGKRIYAWSFTGTLVYMVFLRPAGVITVAFILVYMLGKIDYGRIRRWIFKRLLYVLPCIIVFLFAFIYVIYIVMNDSLGMSLYWNMRWLLYDNYSAGQVFDLPTGLDHKYTAIKNTKYLNNFVLSFFINNWSHVLILYTKRFISFWGGLWIWGYHFGSLKEAVGYGLRLLPILIMIAGMGRVIYKKAVERTLILFIPIISAVIFCIVYFIDCAWRYRLPSLPFNGIFMAYGADLAIGIGVLMLHKLGIYGAMKKVLYEKMLPSRKDTFL